MISVSEIDEYNEKTRSFVLSFFRKEIFSSVIEFGVSEMEFL